MKVIKLLVASALLVLSFVGNEPTATEVPAFDHVFIVALENQGFSEAMAGMPFLNELANHYGTATNFFANTHPSIGNYFWLTTGQNITNDSNFAGTVTADNIVRQLNLAGKSWRSYAENLPSVGYTGGNANFYVKRHNPFAYFSDVVNNPVQANNLVPFSQFATDLANGQLPNYSFIIPNQYHNSHDCPPSIPNCTNADKLTTADQWLQANIDPLISSATFKQSGLLIITWDESVNTDTQNGGGHVVTLVISSNAKQGFKSSTFYQHQNTLRTVAEALGLTSFPGAAAAAQNFAEFFTATPTPTPTPTPTSTPTPTPTPNPTPTPTPIGPTLFVELGTNRLAAVDSLTLVRGPFPLTNFQNFTSDQRTRITFYATDLGFSQISEPDVGTLSVQVAGNSYPVEAVGPDAISQGSFIVFRLPDLSPGTYPLSIRLRGVNSLNSPDLIIVASFIT